MPNWLLLTPFWIPMIAFTILILLILMTWLRVARPSRQRLSGTVIYDARLPLLARLRMQLVPCTLVLSVAVLLVAFAALPWWGPLVAIISNLGLVMLPVRYSLTTTGVQSGWTPRRRWTEFAGVARAPGGARLQGAAGSRDMRVWLSGSRGDDEFVHLLRRMISSGYKGRNVLLEFPPESSEGGPGASAASTDITRTAM